jgi:hypothetical protein
MTIRLALKTNPPGVNRDIAGRLDEVCFTRKNGNQRWRMRAGNKPGHRRSTNHCACRLFEERQGRVGAKN